MESVEVDFASGFSVITGETGAGKSVFLGAIAMMLGQRSDVKSIREGADRCVIEGHFDISSFSLQSFFEENELRRIPVRGPDIQGARGSPLFRAQRNWIDENLFSGFSAIGYHIMNSLRDTDTQLIIELE